MKKHQKNYFSKTPNGPIWALWFSKITNTNTFGTLFGSFGTFFISGGWLRTVVEWVLTKQKASTTFDPADQSGEMTAIKSKGRRQKKRLEKSGQADRLG